MSPLLPGLPRLIGIGGAGGVGYLEIAAVILWIGTIRRFAKQPAEPAAKLQAKQPKGKQNGRWLPAFDGVIGSGYENVC